LGVSNILNELSVSLEIDSSFAFICADFAPLLLKVAKYINTVQTSAFADVDYSSPAKLFLCYQKQVAMQQQNLSLNQLPAKIIQPSLAVKNNLLPKRNDCEKKSCKHRNENGWCSKSQRQCSLITDLFF